jgi:glycosyltransferase involved in cell wall biosynthesis
MTIILFQDYIEEKHISHDVYSENIFQQLYQQIAINKFRPQIPQKYAQNRLNLEFYRYFVYPVEAKKNLQKDDIAHIIGPGYSHLLTLLDPYRTIITVHDIIPILKWHNQLLEQNKKQPLAYFSMSFLRNAKNLIAVSKNTKNDLIQWLGCKEENIHVIYNGISKDFYPYDEIYKKDSLLKTNLPIKTTGKFCVLISGSTPHKNIARSVNAFSRFIAKFPDDKFELIKLGEETEEWKNSIKQNNLENNSICLGRLEDKFIPILYNSIDCLLFPSIYEGFGLVPIEVMACGKPVIVSNTSSLPEVVEDAGIQVDPLNVDLIADALRKIYVDKQFRNDLVQKGINHSKKFNWEKTAEEVFDLYQKLLQNNSHI